MGGGLENTRSMLSGLEFPYNNVLNTVILDESPARAAMGGLFVILDKFMTSAFLLLQTWYTRIICIMVVQVYSSRLH